MSENQVAERFEEVLELIWTMSEKEIYSGTEILADPGTDFSEDDLLYLGDKGFICLEGGQVLFTDRGKRYAESIVRRNRLTEVLLSSVLKMKNGQRAEIACRTEHTLLPEVEEAICTLLGHPDTCPNGLKIPRGKCCGRYVSTISNIASTLDELHAGDRGRISFIKPSNHAQLHQLLSFGLSPGVVVRIHRKKPAICITFEGTELALDDEIAKNIYVVKIH